MKRLNELFRSSTSRNSTSLMKRQGASTEAQSGDHASSARVSSYSIRLLQSKAIRNSKIAIVLTTVCIMNYDREEGVD